MRFQLRAPDPKKFRLDIVTFWDVGGIHFYGSIKHDGDYLRRVHDVEHPSYYKTAEGERVCFPSIKFYTVKALIAAAVKWFQTSDEVPEGAKLVVDREWAEQAGLR